MSADCIGPDNGPIPPMANENIRVPLRSGEKLVAYLSDCSLVPGEIVDLISRVKVLVIDALRDKPHPTHLSVGQALEIARRVRPGATYFTHICHELPQGAESRLPAATYIAYDGLKLKF
jgi:phosphoribosyl 1,2-cyclic phosphate phosphodiesterase